jgi:hypothetical protein
MAVLAAALAAFKDPEEAQRAYGKVRRPAMNEFAIKNRELGAETILPLVEERAPKGFSRFEDVISRGA